MLLSLQQARSHKWLSSVMMQKGPGLFCGIVVSFFFLSPWKQRSRRRAPKVDKARDEPWYRQEKSSQRLGMEGIQSSSCCLPRILSLALTLGPTGGFYKVSLRGAHKPHHLPHWCKGYGTVRILLQFPCPAFTQADPELPAKSVDPPGCLPW